MNVLIFFTSFISLYSICNVLKMNETLLNGNHKVSQNYLNFEERLPDVGLPEEGFDIS